MAKEGITLGWLRLSKAEFIRDELCLFGIPTDWDYDLPARMICGITYVPVEIDLKTACRKHDQDRIWDVLNARTSRSDLYLGDVKVIKANEAGA